MKNFEKELKRAIEDAVDEAIHEIELEFECPNCGKLLKYKIPKHLKKVYCRHCRQKITLKSNI